LNHFITYIRNIRSQYGGVKSWNERFYIQEL
jgi:hypothetical protein